MNMPSTTPQIGLLRALEVLRQPADILLMTLSGGLSVSLMSYGIGSWALRHGGLLALLLAGCGWLIGMTGYCAVSRRRLDVLEGQTPPGPIAVLVPAAGAALKASLSLLLLAAALMLIMLAAALLFVVTQIPGIGPALNYLVFPIAALILGVSAYALMFIAVPLTSIAICDGRSVLGSVATVLVIVRSRLLDVAARGVLIGLLAGFIVGLAMMIVSLGVGLAASTRLSVTFGAHGGYGGYGDSYGLSELAMLGSAGGPWTALLAPLQAAGASSAVLYFVALSLGAVLYAGGWAALYHRELRALDPSVMEQRLREQQQRLQQAAKDAQIKARKLAREHAARDSGDPSNPSNPSNPGDPDNSGNPGNPGNP